MEPTTPLDPIPSQGPVVGIIIVIIVLVVGAFYFFTRLSGVNMGEPLDNATTSGETSFSPVGTSDEPGAIENDLAAEDFENIDSEMGALDAEFGY